MTMNKVLITVIGLVVVLLLSWQVRVNADVLASERQPAALQYTVQVLEQGHSTSLLY